MWDGLKRVFGGIKTHLGKNLDFFRQAEQDPFWRRPLAETLGGGEMAQTPGFVPESVGREIGARMGGVARPTAEIPTVGLDEVPETVRNARFGEPSITARPSELPPLAIPPSPLARPATAAAPAAGSLTTDEYMRQQYPQANAAPAPAPNFGPAVRDARPMPFNDLRREARFRAKYGSEGRAYDDPIEERRIQAVYGDAVTAGTPEERLAAMDKLEHPGFKGRLKAGLKPALAGFVQGTMATGDWRGGVAGAGTAMAASAIDPIGGAEYYQRSMVEPRMLRDEARGFQRRQQQRQEADTELSMQARQAQITNLEADNRRADRAQEMMGEQQGWMREDRAAQREAQNYVNVNGNLVDRRTGRVLFSAPRQRRLMNVGGTVIDEDTGEEVYQGPVSETDRDRRGTREVDANWDEMGFRQKYEADNRQKLYDRLYITPDVIERARSGDERAVAQIQKAEEQLTQMTETASKAERRRFEGRATGAASRYRPTRQGKGARPPANTSTAPRSPADLAPLLR